MKDEREFWVIEIGHTMNRPDKRPRYWDGRGHDITDEIQWAVRFADKQSAERMAALHLTPDTWIAVEHGWIAAASRTAEGEGK